MHRLPLLLLACCGLAACSGEAPFVEQYAADIRKYSGLYVCHDQDASREAIEARAAEGCALADKLPQYQGEERFQCRLMSPHRSVYKCVDKPKP